MVPPPRRRFSVSRSFGERLRSGRPPGQWRPSPRAAGEKHRRQRLRAAVKGLFADHPSPRRNLFTPTASRCLGSPTARSAACCGRERGRSDLPPRPAVPESRRLLPDLGPAGAEQELLFSEQAAQDRACSADGAPRSAEPRPARPRRALRQRIADDKCACASAASRTLHHDWDELPVGPRIGRALCASSPRETRGDRSASRIAGGAPPGSMAP
jgi:hypothetical protein